MSRKWPNTTKFQPDSRMRIYFMGICGTAMGNAALLLKEMGHDVIGADSGIYPR